jgi:hypothetical protein
LEFSREVPVNEETFDYVHQPLEEEIMAIGGHYRFTDEVRLSVGGGEVLYLKGYALFDSTCCGAGGCGYARVMGWIDRWKDRTDEEGYAVSRLRPVADPAQRQKIDRLIMDREMVQQVRFK